MCFGISLKRGRSGDDFDLRIDFGFQFAWIRHDPSERQQFGT